MLMKLLLELEGINDERINNHFVVCNAGDELKLRGTRTIQLMKRIEEYGVATTPVSARRKNGLFYLFIFLYMFKCFMFYDIGSPVTSRCTIKYPQCTHKKKIMIMGLKSTLFEKKTKRIVYLIVIDYSYENIFCLSGGKKRTNKKKKKEEIRKKEKNFGDKLKKRNNKKEKEKIKEKKRIF
ncbi:hypothetical protein RFI_40357 [Reticulomyxa filosa]|uniref:Uncharacterized protein n=1 Tax=Reticulomyxa filosa TaxID=46433 RepID=X6L792_RETFI|nr:hypothetical protein RFI_40357 [Reticulomyxa filosa]|eukprot:ETN97175.1 hypothetical protein RFI_40357 [Reticulomyxa filosa]